MTLYGKIISCAALALVLSLTSCSNEDNSRILEYRSSDAQFTLTFPSAYGDVVCGGVRTADTTTITVLEPARSQGFTVKVTGDSCIISSDGMAEIPLSAEASAGLTRIISTMYSPLPDAPEAARTSDGEQTIVTTPHGTLYLDEDLLPCAVECEAWNGEARTVTVTDYTVN